MQTVIAIKNVKCAIYFDPVLLAHDGDDVIDLENRPDGLGGQSECRSSHHQRLQDILVQDVGHSTFAHVDACSLVTLCVSLTQFYVKSCVIKQPRV